MKNLDYIPVYRNRYFYGKLLTAEDFLQEQRYVNDKRRMINRWMLGAGIVAGLEVIRVDDYHISLEMGLALDETGREILVEAPVIKKLSTLDGFEEATQNTGDETLYLCIEYDESNMEPVQTIAHSMVHTSQETEYNKAKEGYHLFVTDDEPEIAETAEGTQNELRYIQDRAAKIMRNTYQQAIYLAKIYLVKAGPFYMIEKMEPVPFQQLAYSNRMMMGEIRRLQSEWMEKEYLERHHEAKGDQRKEEVSTSSWQLSDGSFEVTLAKRRKEGETELSDWIPHGLGLGDVQMFLRILWNGYGYCGDEGVFPEEEQKAVLASRVNCQDGTFQLGVRFLQDVEAGTRVAVHWTALRNKERNEIKELEPRIYIKPSMARVRPREEYQFEAICVNMEDTGVFWTVGTDGGGTIEEDGTYFAPGRAGIYEVSVHSKAYQGVSSIGFVVVRD